MTNEQIEKYKQELYVIHKVGNLKEQWMQLVALAEKLNAPIPAGLHDVYTIDSINKITPNIHNSLQTEMMLNACVSAEQSAITSKWACIWAAVAAIASAIGAIAVLMVLFIK